MTVLGLTAVALLGLMIAGPASADRLELEARYWQPDLTTSISDINGLPLDLGQGLDLALEVDDAVEGRLTLNPGGGFFLRARYQTLTSVGNQSLDFDFESGGINLQISADIESSLDFDYGGVALGWQFVSPSRKVRIGPFVEAKGVQGDAAVQVAALGQSQGIVEDFEAGFASFGGLLEIELSSRVQLFAEYSVLVDDDEADLTDAEVGLRFFSSDVLGLGVGFRSLQIDGEVDGVRLDLDYEGAFGSLLLRF